MHFLHCPDHHKGRSITSSPVPKRRKIATATSTPFYIKNTYTATFCRLDQNSEVLPSTKEQYALSCNSVGKKRHSLDKDGNHTYIKAELEKVFSRLKAVGGNFQLYRIMEEVGNGISIKRLWGHKDTQQNGSVMTGPGLEISASHRSLTSKFNSLIGKFCCLPDQHDWCISQQTHFQN